MRFTEDVVNYGDAPEIYVSGVASVCQISQGTVRITFYTNHNREDGTVEKRVAQSQVWDHTEFMEIGAVFDQSRRELSHGSLARLRKVHASAN